SAADAALDMLAGTVRAVRDEPMQATLTLPQAAQMVVAWSLVHGFAMLLLDDRLKQLIAKLPPGIDEMAFLPAIVSAALPKTWTTLGRRGRPGSRRAAEQRDDLASVAVGTPVTGRPPRGSVHAAFPHTAPTSSHNGKCLPYAFQRL